jgi:BioD-like phosphotransacetylase family protein
MTRSLWLYSASTRERRSSISFFLARSFSLSTIKIIIINNIIIHYDTSKLNNKQRKQLKKY